MSETEPTPTPVQNCGNCIYRFQTTVEQYNMNPQLECRRYAPRPATEGIQHWPIIRIEDWCGEYKIG